MNSVNKDVNFFLENSDTKSDVSLFWNGTPLTVKNIQIKKKIVSFFSFEDIFLMNYLSLLYLTLKII